MGEFGNRVEVLGFCGIGFRIKHNLQTGWIRGEKIELHPYKWVCGHIIAMDDYPMHFSDTCLL